MVYKLIVVESDPAVSGWMESRLRPAGFEITSFADGISALDMLSSLDPDLVLIEQDPKGISLARFSDKLKQKSLVKKRPLLLLTNAAAPLNDDQIRLSGVTDFVKKPIQMEALIERIKLHLAPSAVPAIKAARTAPAPEPHYAENIPSTQSAVQTAAEDQKQEKRIEELLGWSLPGERTIVEAIDAAAPDVMPDAMVDEDSTIVESIHRPAPRTFGPEPEAAPAIMPDDDRTIVESGVDSGFLAAGAPVGPAEEPPPEQPPAASEPLPESFSFGADPFAAEPAAAANLSMESVLSHGTMAEMAQDSVTAREWMPPSSGPIESEPATMERYESMAESAASHEPPAPASAEPAPLSISHDLVQSEVKRIVQEIIEKVAWDVVPGMAEALIKEEIEKLKTNRPS